MRNASLLHPPTRRESAVTDSNAERLCSPHIYRPESDSRREFGQLFNLRRRPGYYNAEAKAALLRLNKQAPHDELFVDFSTSQVQIALAVADIPLATGDWTWGATVGDERLECEGPWTAVCWQSKKAFDYLEIESPLSNGWKLKRQMLLAREDRFLLLADALIGSQTEPVEIRYSTTLPLAAGVKFGAARETREGWLESGGRRRTTIVPPALAEWRCEFCHAELLGTNGGIGLQQAALGHSLYAPLWIDLDPGRLKRPITWRRLTVAENFAAVGRDIAAAYRIQAGREQWMIYRSVARRGNRSVMGHNTLKSFVCEQIDAGGTTKKIVTVD